MTTSRACLFVGVAWFIGGNIAAGIACALIVGAIAVNRLERIEASLEAAQSELEAMRFVLPEATLAKVGEAHELMFGEKPAGGEKPEAPPENPSNVTGLASYRRDRRRG